jgi:hypothetical protein
MKTIKPITSWDQISVRLIQQLHKIGKVKDVEIIYSTLQMAYGLSKEQIDTMNLSIVIRCLTLLQSFQKIFQLRTLNVTFT